MTGAALPRARRLPDAVSDSAFRRSGAALLLTAFGGPFWNVLLLPLPGASLTVGRALIVLTALLLALDLRRAPRPLPRVTRAVWVLLGVLALLWSWTIVNALAWGCRCAGEIAGFSELLALVALAAFAGTFEPRLRPVLVLAVIAGAVLTALLTLAGLDGLSAGAQNPSPDYGRLAGPYGNPNFLAFAIGFAIPAGIVALWVWTGPERVVLALAVALVGVVLLLTFSRGGLLSAAVGAVLVLVLVQRRGSRAQWRTIAAIALAGAAAAVVYPIFVEQRRESTSPMLEAQLRSLDRSGWEGATQGLIPGAPTEMRNPSPDVLEVRADGPGRGVSRALPRARPGDSYELRFEARAQTGAQGLRFGLEDNLLGNGPAVRAATLGSEWQAVQVQWEPTAESPSARFYIWAPAAGPAFQLREVRTIARRPGEAPVTTTISPVLAGNRFGELKTLQARRDARDIRSREIGVELALQAFGSQPVRGIGWGRFPQYSTANSEFRGLPTHNEYLRYLAELGLVGIGLLALAALVVASTFWRRRLDRLSVALLGMLATGAVGLVFVNGLATAAAAAPLGFAVALACARTGPREQAQLAEASDLWPTAAGRRARDRSIRDLGGDWADWLRGDGRASAGRPASWGPPALERMRAAAPRPAPATLVAPAHTVADGVAQLRQVAPAATPEGWATWLREAERDLRRVARGTGERLRTDGARALAAGGAVTIGIGSRAAWALGVGALALVARLPIMFERHAIVAGGDSAEYVGLARTFFDQSVVSVVRPPGYPLFLALSGLLPGRLEDTAVGLQLAIGVALCSAVVFFAWPLFGRLAAITAGLLLALSGAFLSIEAVLLADMLFGVFVTVAAGLLAAAALDERRRLRWLIATAVAIACAVYVKPVGHALVLAPLVPLALATRSWRATLLGSAVVWTVVALLTVPWMARNEIRYGSFAMSAQTGVTLFNRVFERDRIAIPTTTPTGRLAADFQRRNPGRRLSSGVAEVLVGQGDTMAEAERKMRAVALEAARRSPQAFAAGTARSTYEVFSDVAHGEPAAEAGLAAFVTGGSLPEATRVGLRAGGVVRALWLVCCLGGLAAALWLVSRSRETRVAAAAALGVWGSVAVATAATHGGQFRYSASLAPLTFLLGAAGLAVAVKLARQLMGVGGAGVPAPSLGALVRNAATPSAGVDPEVRSSVR